ncbi:HDOD domain-containing protein [Bremerella cremea]|uniref:HDOD domain-containing protein n=1 Tax=Bremerella cremea TaxID=1031537 RepID=A0A368KSD3_9BACT|nr:HDOD domain-containing protein [Bremerella cremea]RCS48224.1 HDOD domain-containing protein [Bremerella cremea]
MNQIVSAPVIVLDAIQRVRNIATLPEVASKVRQLVDDPECTADDVDRVVRNDPALSTRILRVVNSSFYGMPGQFSSVKRAIVFLGLNAIKNITIAASLNKIFRPQSIQPPFKVENLWNHSIAVAAISRQLANQAGTVSSDDAFLAGLIHDVGIIVELQACRAEFGDVLQRFTKDPDLSLCDAERQVFGVTHEAFGAELCRAWMFPEQLVDVTGNHHDPSALPEQRRTMPRIVHLADILADKAGMPAAMRSDSKKLDPELLEDIGVTTTDLAAIAQHLPAEIAEVKQVFAI